ncbi:MAG: heat-inducible transcriptional repressor HrcA [Alphaproteobacteria bacterium]|nr:heat-inducible transcriptional repressor HrcA [Alphaproteobacteria bacterium]
MAKIDLDRFSSPPTGSAIVQLSERSREIFRHIVDAYVETGEPVGSRTLSRRLGAVLSPATVRNVMADLEDAGLLFAPHTSAGRLPTEAGLRVFVDGLLEIGGDLSDAERANIDGKCAAAGRSVAQMFEEASATLAGLSRCAGLVVSPKMAAGLRHIEFVPLNRERALVVMVTASGLVENRILELPPGLPSSVLVEATNYLNHRLNGRTIDEVRDDIEQEITLRKAELDELTSKVVQAGLATWGGDVPEGSSLILRGQAQLLEDVTVLEDLEQVRGLFEQLEEKESTLRLLEATGEADGVQIFIGAENQLFRNTGCSMIIAPYHDQQRTVVGAIGVIGPTRMNYARIIPMVDYTAKLIGRLLD